MMSPSMRRFYVYAIVLGIAFILIFVPLVIPMLSREADYSVFNTEWNGTSSFYGTYAAEHAISRPLTPSDDVYMNAVLTSLTKLDVEPSCSMLLMLGPSKGYMDDELSYLDSFVRNGGVVILADDFGNGNEVLSHLGVSERFSGELLVDLSFEKAGTFPVTYQGTLGDMTLLLNHPSSIINATDPLITSSPLAFHDVNENGVLDENESAGTRTIVSQVSVGDGMLYLVSDPSIFINDMVGRYDNERFAFELLARAEGDTVRSLYVDEAHFSKDEAFRVVDVVIATTSERLFQAAVIALLAFIVLYELRIPALVGGALRSATTRIFGVQEKVEKGLSKKELVEELHRRHPEWDINALYTFFSRFRTR
ncbi:MAG TPA: DUF4350 domain-containing protein [Methanomicrobia archaeon]|nr:DUF4350 domain-containing protein [Methanomicrobia archaeon]